MKNPSNFKTKVVTLFVLSLAAFFVLSLQLVSSNIQNVFQSWGKNFQISVYFDETASESEIQSALAVAKKNSAAKNVELFEQQKTFELFRTQMAGYAPEIFQDDLLIPSLPISAQIDLDENLSVADKQQAATEIKQALSKMKGVEEVNLGGELFARYTKVGEGLQFFTTILTLLVVLLSWFAIANMMNQLIRDRSEEIAIHELFGASNWQVRRGFYGESILISTLAAGIAMILLGLFFSFSLGTIERAVGFLNLHQYLTFYSPLHIALIFLLAPMIGLTSAHLSLRKLNTGWLAAKV